ncbi:cohesin subunit SA-2 [Bombina bombina]|uniref:cohesin subunit SA-2 n=1 Tax=Bombina bombina TaxID=8345 RepID=UPI00235A5880|nr:cohesin subunit SA-2 [Bombina bombina]
MVMKKFQIVYIYMKLEIDVVSDIRALCMEEIGIWMKLYPQLYLNDSCLKYIGWMLYDKVPEVRLKSLIALQGLYDKKDFVSKMDLFTTRFKDRIVSMTLDKVNDVSVQAMKLLVHMSQHCEDLFTAEDCDSLYQFVYASYRPLAAAAGELLFKRHLNQVLPGEASVQEIQNTLLSASQLKSLLAFFCESELHEHLTYLVDSLWDCTPVFLKDWKCMSSILLHDTNEEEGGLNAEQENLLIELILASVRQAVEAHPPVGRGTSRKVLSAKEKRMQQEDSIRITEHFAETLPLLLAKYVSDSVKVTSLLQMLQYFDVEVYTSGSMDRQLESLLKQIRHIVVEHSDPLVLEACSKAYSSLCKEDLSNHTRVQLSMRQLIDDLVDTLDQMLNDILQEGEETLTAEDVHPMSCVLRRLAAFHNAHNLSQWNLYQRTSQLLLFDAEHQCLPVQLVLPAFQCMYYAVFWLLVLVTEESTPKVEPISFQTQVTSFWQLCRHYLRHKDQSISEQAFLSLCDLLLLLSHNDNVGGIPCDADSTLESEMLLFIQQHVFQSDDEKSKDNEVDQNLMSLHRKRNLLAVYCKLIAYNVIEMSSASEIYKQYMKTYNDFGDIIKETLSRTRQNNRIESAKTLVLCLQQLFQKHKEAHDGANQFSSSFTNIKELARRFSLTFGMDLVKYRESLAMMHKQGIEFAFRERAAEDGLPPPNLTFLTLISEFSSRLLKPDKRLVYGYLQRFANDQMLLHKGEAWQPLVVYSNSLLDNQDDESSFTSSYFSSPAQNLKRKQSYESISGNGENETHPSEVQIRNILVKKQIPHDCTSLNNQSTSFEQISQNIYSDEGNIEVDVDEVVTQVCPEVQQ